MIAGDDRPPEGAARVAGVPGLAGAPRVTLDTTSDSTSTAASTGGEPVAEGTTAAARPRRATRTRATRAAQAPGEPAPEAAAPETPAAPADAAAGGAVDDAPTKPVRRRAPRKTKAQLAAEAAEAETLDAAVDAPPPAVPVETVEAVPAEEAPAAPKRRRSTRKAAAPGTPEVAAPVEPAPVEPAPVEVAPAAAAPARRSRRATRPAAAPVDAVAPVAQPAPVAAVVAADVVVLEEDVEEEEVAEAVEQAEETSAVQPRERLDVLAELGRTEPEQPTAQPAAQQSSRSTTRGARSDRSDRSVSGSTSSATSGEERPAAARLATTALLFQAPEAPRRRRRAQAPSGSPEAISAAAQAEVDAALAQQAEVEVPAEDAPAPVRRRGRRGRTRVAEVAEPVTEDVDTDEVSEVVVADAETFDADTDAEDGTERDDADTDTDESGAPRRRRRRGGRGRRSRGASDGETADSEASVEDGDGPVDDVEQAEDAEAEGTDDAEGSDDQADGDEQGGSSRRRRRRRRSGRGGDAEAEPSSSSSSSRGGRSGSGARSDEVTALRGSTRLEAKRQRRREGRDAGRRRQIITEAEFLARRESVERSMIVREANGKTQIAVLEDGVLVEHYVSRQAQVSMAGNVYLGRVQNVLPSMEAAFVDVGKGRNAVLYAGEVNWDAAGLEGGQTRRIEQALKSGDSVLVQVTKDPIGHKGARLTSQITLAGRYLVYVPGGGMTGISRKLPEPERARLKKILREVVPDSAGVIVRTAAEGASEEELRADIARLQAQWEAIEKKAKTASAPALLQGEPDLAIRVVRDIFNDDFSSLVVQGDEAWSTVSGYIGELAPDLAQKVSKYTGTGDVFHDHRVDEQLAKGMDRKVWLPSGGSLVIDRTEAMTVVDVNTGKFTGAGGTLEETVTRNNLEAAEEIVRQLRLRDIGGIIVIDFIDMVLESNRDLVLRRLVECLGRDRTKHQVAEVTSLGLVQMTRKRVGQGLVEAFSETCEHCNGRGFVVHTEPVERNGQGGHGGTGGTGGGRPEAGAAQPAAEGDGKKSRRKRGGAKEQPATASASAAAVPVLPEAREAVKATLATIAAAAAHAHVHDGDAHDAPVEGGAAPSTPASVEVAAAQPAVTQSAAAQSAAAQPAAAEPAHEPVLDVFAALGDLAIRPASTEPAPARSTRPARGGAEPQLELTPVDPGLFELPEASEASEGPQGSEPGGSNSLDGSADASS
jgi:ribonuclease E